jgi:hypothetical protein
MAVPLDTAVFIDVAILPTKLKAPEEPFQR